MKIQKIILLMMATIICFAPNLYAEALYEGVDVNEGGGVNANKSVDQNKKTPKSLQQKGNKVSVAVLSSSDFTPDWVKLNLAGTPHQIIGLPEVLASRIIENLVQSKRFIPVERTVFRRAIVEQRFNAPAMKKTSVSGRESYPKMETMSDVFAYSTYNLARVAYEDFFKDFHDLGTSAAADYIIFGNLEKFDSKLVKNQLPYVSKENALDEHRVDARVQLRVIDVKNAQVLSVDSFRKKFKYDIFEGIEPKEDEFSVYDEIADEASRRILDLVFPAKVVSISPLLLSRGSNDNVSVGDEYQIVREGKRIEDELELDLGALRSEIAKVRVLSTTENFSVFEVTSGEGVALEDLALPVNVLQMKNQATELEEVSGESRAEADKKFVIALGKVILTPKTPVTEGFSVDHYIQRIRDTFIVKLSETESFEVLERAEMDQLVTEKKFSAKTGKEEMDQQLTSLTDADYLLYGEVNLFYFLHENEVVPVVVEVQDSFEGRAEGIFRLVEVKTGKVVAANKVRKILKETSSNLSAGFIEENLSTLLDDFVAEVVSKTRQKILPGQDSSIDLEPEAVEMKTNKKHPNW